ncbi:MAG: hypothetical protein IJ058_01830 [Lachnospiraceae bacterium]|nr:hypothetical protein [Lachnospiraceae bacterium]
MSSYIDRLEKNLSDKVSVLENIYESDRRIIESVNSSQTGIEIYDEYMMEQDSYLSRLDELDQEYDVIYAYIEKYREELSGVSADRRSHIVTLSKEIEGKLIAVNDIEERVRKLVEVHFNNRKSAIQASRKNAKTLQDRYRSASIFAVRENTILDIVN